MSIILNETKVYPGWEIHKNKTAAEEKALLISLKQNFIFLFTKLKNILPANIHKK